MFKDDHRIIDLNFRPEGYTNRDRSLYTQYCDLVGDARINKVRQLLIHNPYYQRQWAYKLACEELEESHRDWLASREWYSGVDCEVVRNEPAVIVDIVLASTLGDNYWIIAEKLESGYKYKIEHDADIDESVVQPFYESKLPLTLHELITLIEQSYIPGDICAEYGLVRSMWVGSLEGSNPEKASKTVRIDSIFYPGLEKYYLSRASEFVKEHTYDEDDD